MKMTNMAVAVLAATAFMTACAKQESAAPPDTPATTAAPAPAEPPPAATSEVPNTEDGSQTSGDKVSPKPNEAAPPPN